MTPRQRVILVLVASALCLLIGIYYLIPHIPHPLTFSASTDSHPTHALLFFGLAVLGVIASRFIARSSSSTPKP